MSVEIIPVGLLKRYVQSDELPIRQDAAGKTIAALLNELGLPPSVVAIALVNGRQVEKSYTLADGDIVKLVPIVGGG
ncbi:MAG: MoaD/ThiS family protein [Chloroflexi bacterium]|nr:MoaD/ThiS family protein [Chloroflexota bacterium]